MSPYCYRLCNVLRSVLLPLNILIIPFPKDIHCPLRRKVKTSLRRNERCQRPKLYDLKLSLLLFSKIDNGVRTFLCSLRGYIFRKLLLA